MIRNKGTVLSREKIENHVWNFDYSGGTNVVDVYIRYLRKKIDDSYEQKLIHTIKPVEKISNTAKNIIDSGDLSQRINIGKNSDEISDLANTFDSMLTKIETTFENEKQFTSDASHELRTPVAVIMSECEYMIDCAQTFDEYKESANQ